MVNNKFNNCIGQRRGKITKATKIFAYTVTALVMLALTISSVSASTTSTFSVTQASQTKFLLPMGTIFNGSISVSGTLRFWASAPDGSQIVNLGLIDHSASFGFVVSQDGNYTMNFENGLPMANPVQVSFSYTTNPDVTSNNNSTGTPLAYWATMALIVVLATVLIVLLVRRKKDRGLTVQGEVTSNSSVNLFESVLLSGFRA
jgi:hypothetical protein